MRLIVVTQPYFFAGEAARIEALFRAGLELLHLRKPASSAEECGALLEQLPPFCRGRIVTHDHFGLVARFGLRGVHLNGRNPLPPPGFAGQRSASCHSLEELAGRKREGFDYLFLSPIFPSISKEGYGSGFSLEELRAARNIIDGKVIALGGIDPERIRQLSDLPFGGVAVLGALWGSAPSLDTAESIIRQYKRMAYELTR